MTIAAKIEKAFAKLDAKLIASDQAFAAAKMDTRAEAIEEMKAGFAAKDPKFADLTGGYGRFCHSMATARHFGGKGMAALLCGHGREGGLANMRKNTEALIAKRNANIEKALAKKGIEKIEEFELRETSDGYEGFFEIDGHKVTIQTILAGGYNIQRLHQRTLIKIK